MEGAAGEKCHAPHIHDGKGTMYNGAPGEFTITITHHESITFGGVIEGTLAGPGGKRGIIRGVQFIEDTAL